ncbi:MAG: potassium transporter TrkA [Candidatus Nitrosopolaris wilkensis]|nr:MAG: potassium transporter TrkA [Candidatus Nitrosopolaris wilkensis]
MILSSTTGSNQERICSNILSPRSTFSNSIINSTEDELCTKYKYNTNTQFNKVLIIGLGQLGLTVARYVTEKGFDTYGFDISNQAIERAEKTTAVKKAINFGEFDVYIICVSTHKPDDLFSPQIDGLLSIAEKISREAKDGALVSIESTIPNGTSKKVFEMLSHRLHVVHAPHRWYAAEEKEHGVNQLRVIGGVCDCCLKAGLQFYGLNNDTTNTTNTTIGITNPITSNSIDGNNNNYDDNNGNENKDKQKSLGIPMHPVSEVEIAETTKIVENAHRYLQIAFAEDLYLYCQANDINFPELRDALNTKWNVNILEPREGIGGHCLPKDTKMFLQSSNRNNSKILTAAMDVDEDYKRFRAKLEKQIKSATY